MTLKDLFHHKDKTAKSKGSSDVLSSKGIGKLLNKSTTSASLEDMKKLGAKDRGKAKTFNHQQVAPKTHHGAIQAPGAVARKRNNTLSAPGVPLPSIDNAPVKKPTIVYNPYGVLSGSNYSNSHYGNSYYGNTNHTNTGTNLSAYLEDKPELLPLPIELPNNFLPDCLHLEHADMYTEYVLPDADSSKNKKLGIGASAAVRTVLRRQDKKVFALKKFSLFHKEEPDVFYKRCAKEFFIAKSLSSYPHIVSTIALLRVPSISTLQRGWGFILEYCPQGDLFSLVQRSGWKSLNHEEKFCLFKQVALGMRFIHDNDIVHRDLKPENVLLSDKGVVKLTDFGVSTYGHEEPGNLQSPVKLFTAFVGSQPYSPPEVMYFKSWNKKMADDPHLPRYDAFKMDCWSLGMLLFCMVYQGTPFTLASTTDSHYRDYVDAYSQFTSRNPQFRKDKVKGPGVEYKYGRDFHDLGASRVAWRLCDPVPATRYTMTDLFDDPWFLKLEMCVHEPDEQMLVDKLVNHKCTTGLLLSETSKSIVESTGNSANNTKNKSAVELPPLAEAKEDLRPSDEELALATGKLDLNEVKKTIPENIPEVPSSPTKEVPTSPIKAETPVKTELEAPVKAPADAPTPNKDTPVLQKSGSATSVRSEASFNQIGSPFFLENLPDDKYCQGKFKKHHHNEIIDITLNALGK